MAQLAQRVGANADECKKARDCGAVEVFLSLLDSWDPFVQEKTAHALASMFALDPPSADLVIKAGVTEKLTILSKDAYTKTVREAAAWALTALAVKRSGYVAVEKANGGVLAAQEVLREEEGIIAERREARRLKHEVLSLIHI